MICCLLRDHKRLFCSVNPNANFADQSCPTIVTSSFVTFSSPALNRSRWRSGLSCYSSLLLETWEGFIGAFFFTCMFAFYFSVFLAKFDWFICPVQNLYFRPQILHCKPNPLFISTEFIVVSHYCLVELRGVSRLWAPIRCILGGGGGFSWRSVYK